MNLPHEISLCTLDLLRMGQFKDMPESEWSALKGILYDCFFNVAVQAVYQTGLRQK